ncbi:MAG TPA: ATP synthase F1 subunit gamma [Clostridiales bacterium]|nr:ATP synthase F1 subunit gamma [Clostridiales bacterium]
MSEISEVKNRIKGVAATQKITNALYLISSAKLRKAKEELEKTAPYFWGIRKEIKSIFKTVDHIESKYFYPENDHMQNAACGYLVITADKGMAGAYNHNVIKRAEKELDLHKKSKLFVVGDLGREYLMSKGYNVAENFTFGALRPTLAVARKIAGILLEGFVNGDYSKLFILYTDMADGEVVIKSTRILPFHTAEFIAEKDKIKEEFEFVPSREVVLDNLVPSYICGYVYSSLVDSYCVEQNARLIAMKSASDNAGGILADLKRDFNHARQNEITTEITEVSSGAKFQRSNKK